jgi:hypothetical protein
MSHKKLLFYVRTKYIEVHYYFIRKKVLLGEINMKLTSTKKLSTSKFEQMQEQFGIISKLMLQKNQH